MAGKQGPYEEDRARLDFAAPDRRSAVIVPAIGPATSGEPRHLRSSKNHRWVQGLTSVTTSTQVLLPANPGDREQHTPCWNLSCCSRARFPSLKCQVSRAGLRSWSGIEKFSQAPQFCPLVMKSETAGKRRQVRPSVDHLGLNPQVLSIAFRSCSQPVVAAP